MYIFLFTIVAIKDNQVKIIASDIGSDSIAFVFIVFLKTV
jgi:hypothetical protein